MFTSAEKTNHFSTVRQKAAASSFFRKAGEESFFCAKDNPVFFNAPVQAKLSVSSPDDPQEKEADAVAEQVMRMPEPVTSPQSNEEEKLQKKEEEQETVQAKQEAPVITVQRKCEACEKEEMAQPKLFRMIQRSEDISSSFDEDASDGSASDYSLNRKECSSYHSGVIYRSERGPPESHTQGSFEQDLSSSKGAGSPLPSDTKQFMESRFNTDFSGVRVHTGNQAESLSNSIQAQAFTHGNDIYFNSGKYAPHTEAGGALLAHELTHTIQQGASNSIQRKAKPVQATAQPPVEMTSLTTGAFTPSDNVAKYIEEGNGSERPVNVSFGNYASGTIRVSKHKDVFKTKKDAQGIPLQLPFLQPLVNAGIQPLLAINIIDGKISGYLTIAVGQTKQVVGKPGSLFDWIKKNPLLMKWSGLENLVAKQDNIINEITGDKIHFEVKDIKVRLGGFVDGSFSIGLFNSAVVVEGNAAVAVKSLANGSLFFKRDEMGDLRGNFEMQASVKNFTGSVKGEFLNGIFDIHGKLRYSTEKLDGEINIVVTDPKQAKALVLQQLEPQQISKEAEERAGVNDPVSGPQPGDRAIAGWGTLNFAFNKWLTGMAKVIVDADGFITVHGEITPPAEVKLFDVKPYRSPNFIDIHPTFRWGIPYIADLHVGLDFLLYAEAQIGPAFLRNIKIIGNYSTDPLLYNDFRVQGTFNLMGYAGLVFTFGAHAGVGILGFDIDLKGALTATAGIKGYVEATPVIGYREQADPVLGKKGEFFIKGQAELAAQPFLGLKGAIGLEVDSPWPIPNFGRSWPMFEKEYPLPGQFGVGLTFGEYILGSGEWPKVDFNKVSFDPEKFKDDLIEKNVPPKKARSEEKEAGFTDELQGQEPEPPAPDLAVEHKASSSEPEKPVAKEVLERWGNGMKAVRELKDRIDEQPVPKETLFSNLKSVKRKFKFETLTASASGQNWSVYAKMPGIDNAVGPIGIRGLQGEEKEARKEDAAIPEGEGLEGASPVVNTNDYNHINISKTLNMNGEDHTIFLTFRSGTPIIEMASGRRALLRELAQNALNEIRGKHGQPWNDMQSEINKLMVKELDPLTERLVGENHSEEFKTPADYENALSRVAFLLTVIGKDFHLKSLSFVLPETSEIRYGPLVNGFASSMEVDMLTKHGPIGSSVNNSLRTEGHMKILDKRKNGNVKYYVLGHLLNDNLHGPGDTFNNLSPITGSSNNIHETQVERFIKIGIDNDRIFKYSVKAEYGRKYDEIMRNYFLAKADHIRASIVEAEQYIPQKFICDVQELWTDGESLTDGLNIKKHIPVIISETENGYEI